MRDEICDLRFGVEIAGSNNHEQHALKMFEEGERVRKKGKARCMVDGKGLGIGLSTAHEYAIYSGGGRVFSLNKTKGGSSREEFQVPGIRRSEVTIFTSGEYTD